MNIQFYEYGYFCCIKNIPLRETIEYNDLLSGVKYASLVQNAIFPKDRHFKRSFEEYFILYEPLYFVSGDFYWVGKRDHFDFLVVGDCTGHGLSASMLSVLLVNIFQYVVMTKGIINPAEILAEVDRKFLECFYNDTVKDYDNDWAEVSLVCINRKRQEFYFSGAKRKLLLAGNNNDSELLKGNEFPIGGWQVEKTRKFDVHIVTYDKGDMLYMGSDGFQDQIGGIKSKKYGSRRLHEMLKSLSPLDVIEQKRILKSELLDWKGTHEQIDDICILGVRL